MRALGIRLTTLALLASLPLNACVSGILPFQSTRPPVAAASSGSSEADPLRAQCVARVNESAQQNNRHRTQTYAFGFALGGLASLLAGFSASAATPDAQRAMGPVAVYVPAGFAAALSLLIPVATSNARADTLTREYTTLSNELEQSDDLAASPDPGDARRRTDLVRRCAQGHTGFIAHASAPAATPATAP